MKILRYTMPMGMMKKIEEDPTDQLADDIYDLEMLIDRISNDRLEGISDNEKELLLNASRKYLRFLQVCHEEAVKIKYNL